jgi:hypothetical protein
MVKPSSFSTLCTSNCANELVGLLLSLSIFHIGAKVYVICDTKTKKIIDEITPRPRLDLIFHLELDKYGGMNRQQMESAGLWSEFQMAKARIIELALEMEPDTLLLDSDIIITGVIDDIDNTKDLGVSPHFMKDDIHQKYGYYNGGMLWTKNKGVPADWIEYTKSSRYFDQASIENLVNKYSNFEFGENYNVQAWRFYLSPTPIQPHFRVTCNNCIEYKNQSLKFFHTHFHDARFSEFNQFIIGQIQKANMYKTLAIVYRVINNAWVLTIPKQPIQGMGRHNNDSYREYPILFKVQNKDVDIRFSEQTIHCWIAPNILTYDRPTLEWCNDEIRKASLILLGNGDVNVEGEQLKQVTNAPIKPWFFWPRRPMLLEKILRTHGILSWENRTVGSIFIGNIENSVQARFRNTDVKWSDSIDEYHCTEGTKHKFSHEEYLLKLRSAKYGLCLRGYGSKCHREVELMAFGTVPIVADGVTTDSYMEPLIENLHFIKVSSPDDFRRKIDDITEEHWTEMSNACYEWYQRNVLSKNAWTNMIEHILYD